MTENFSCVICKINYKTKNGLYKHNSKYHLINIDNSHNTYKCHFCIQVFKSRQSRWYHAQKCKQKILTLEEKVNKLTEKINILEKTSQKIINNNTTNNTTNNIQYVINSPILSSTDHLTYEKRTEILDKGLNSLMCLIEYINFDKLIPENHSYCITAINDKHASVIDEKTNKVIKTNKQDLFDKVLGVNLELLEKLSNDSKYTPTQTQIYKEKINYLKENIFKDNKIMKRYKDDINVISYNNKCMIKKTWESLKNINEDSDSEKDCYDIKAFDNVISEQDHVELCTKQLINGTLINMTESDTESDIESDEEIPDIIVIKIKNKPYIVKGVEVYDKVSGELYGNYINGKVKRIQLNKEIDI
jgi:hypothetical protein